MEQKLLTSGEAAARLRKTPLSFRDAMCRGNAARAKWLAARRIRLGRRYYLHSADVDAVVQLGDAVADPDRLVG
ncbi:hypothetical protein JKG47_06135 [Acidithiobacillus sp. MC6.1]|nr:hypothetical protein [Acidithiobacillus sp. MC6.1]